MKKENQKDKVLKWLNRYGEITTMEGFIDLGITCLPRRIKDLRHDGYEIKTEYRKTSAGTRYGVYTLIDQEAASC